ncbi:CLIP-associating protein 1 [Willisornis vidua]|uniref:CLIP-associating protein 1 n=1 Tax=Willisornis vidua TaxID=1566151 RepID=A0ABQ9DHM8_9PASS|nr:CLIP-associating protein 1 [Willisornis vidua]
MRRLICKRICDYKSFDDEESVDGNRPSSAASAFKVPAPKKPGNPSNSARKPGSAGGPKVGGSSKEGGAGAVDEDDFIKAFTDVPTVQIYSSRELEETLNKIREILSDDKHDWDQRTNAVNFVSVVSHLSTVLGNKFDHGAEAIVPTLFNLVPNSAKVMATSGCAAIRFIIRHTHVPRLIPLITSNCTSKSVAVRRRSFEFLDLLLQEWQTHSLERHAAVLVETIKKGIHDADAEARVEARKAYIGLRNHFPGEAETLYNSLEPPYQRSLQTYLKNSGSIASLPQSDRSSSSSQESLNRPLSSKWSAASPASLAGRGTASEDGRVRTKLSTPSAGIGNSKADSRGRSRTKVVSQSQRTGFGISQSSRLSASVSAMRVLNTGSDVEEAVADALKKPVRRRYESYGMYSDDDANSDASSACSERSYSSRNGSIPTYMRQTEDVAEVLNRCASTNWSERKEGLLGLQNLLKNQRTLSRVELKRLCEIFTRMFADPHSKVFSMFLETLVDFIQVHKEDLQDWLFVLLTQLLKKMGADLLGSVQAKVQKALDVTRESFPNDLQFSILMRFTVDQTQTPSLKVKVAILKYIETLAQQMDPGDFVNSSETRLAVSRIITWTTEPKSSDVRKAAQSVLISLFELNTPEFTMLLGALPKTFQDGATKLLHNHLRNTGNSGQGSMGSPLTRPTPRSPASWSSPLTSPTNTSQNTLSPSAFDYDTENMNSEDIYSSLRGVTEAIQNFSFRSQEDMNEPVKRDAKKDDGDSICSASGVVDMRAGGGGSETGRTALDNKTSLLNTMPPHSTPRARDYNPYNYSDGIGPFNKSALKEAMFDDDAEQFPDEPPMDHSDLVAELLKELSNHNERVEERKAALYELMKLTQEEAFGVWDEHFKTILLLLLETLGDKEVVRSAEEAASMLATSISPDQCIKVLCPIIQTADYPINLAAIKMQTKVIERVSKETLTQLLPEIVPGLIQGYDNSESSVRKACVFCLVAIHAVIGDELKPHLSQLTGSKGVYPDKRENSGAKDDDLC